jgi:hypothetical protein
MTVPIANCLVHGEQPPQLEIDVLQALWFDEASIGGEQMTINVIANTRQTCAP